MNTIQINKQEAIEKIMSDKINELMATGQRGGYVINIFAWNFKTSNKITGKIVFHQDGNYFDSKIGHVCQFGLESFFNWDGPNMDARDLFMINDARSEARTEFKKEHDLTDDDLYNLDDELKSELENKESEYIENCITFTKETLEQNTLDQVDCEDGNGEILHTYKIEWV